MPAYKCPRCGRTVQKPIGRYYCAVCGPKSIMVMSTADNLKVEKTGEAFEEFLRKVFYDEGFREARVEKRTENAYDVILFYETSHPSWVYIRFLNEWVDVHFSFAIRTPHIPEAELKRIFGFKPSEFYSGYVYVRLKSPILVWANVWSDEIHVHHRNFVRDYELKTYIPKVTRELKRIVAELKRNPRAMITNRPRLYGDKYGYDPYKATALIHEITIPEEERRVLQHLKLWSEEAKREWLSKQIS